MAHVRARINSATRQTYLDVGAKCFDGPATQQVVSSGTQSLDPLVTVWVTHRVPPNQVDDFLDWQHRRVQEESRFEGFRGTELLRPNFKLHTIDNSFGSWFAFEGDGKEAPPPPSETRTSRSGSGRCPER